MKINPFGEMDESSESEDDGDEEVRKVKDAERHGAATAIQASWRGRTGRQQVWSDKEAAARTKTLDEYLVTEIFRTREDILRIKRVDWEGDPRWINRLNHELEITQDEFRDGFRYLPSDVELTDSKGRFTPIVVGLRNLADGSFVQVRPSSRCGENCVFTVCVPSTVCVSNRIV